MVALSGRAGDTGVVDDLFVLGTAQRDTLGCATVVHRGFTCVHEIGEESGERTEASEFVADVCAERRCGCQGRLGALETGSGQSSRGW